MANKFKETQNEFLEEIKKSLTNFNTSSEHGTDKDKPQQIEIEEVMRRLENLERQMEITQERDTARQIRVKEKIISLLQERKRLSSAELGKLLGLSRTRSNEYLRQLTKEGVTEGIIVGRQKHYKLVAK
jgi:biotin operon repressor